MRDEAWRMALDALDILDGEARQALVETADRRFVKAATTIISQDEQDDHVYLLLEGWDDLSPSGGCENSIFRTEETCVAAGEAWTAKQLGASVSPLGLMVIGLSVVVMWFQMVRLLVANRAVEAGVSVEDMRHQAVYYSVVSGSARPK